jgi:diaminopimelate epimerase
MNKKIEFYKMQGLGNDFVLMENFDQNSNLYESNFIRRICDRHFGIGADGVVLMEPSKNADLRMRFFNADGSKAGMCGNAIRCLARYVYEKNICRKTEFIVETKAGLKKLKLSLKEDKVDSIEVDMGEPGLQRKNIPMAGNEKDRVIEETIKILDKDMQVTCVSMDNPHTVIFGESFRDNEIEKVGQALQNHPLFPQKTNVEFATIKNKSEVDMLVWERGVGRTMACGTGACAVTVAGVLTKRLARKVQVNLTGGKLQIEWLKTNNRVYMTGPATYVFRGEIEL